MRMLQVEMRQTVEFHVSKQRVSVIFRCGSILARALAVGLVLLLTSQNIQAERITRIKTHQAGSVSDSGSHLLSPKGLSPHTPGYLGILFENLSDEEVIALHLKSGGVEVMMVDHDGPAGKAGLRVHDVIVKLNGQMILSADALRRMIHDAGVGAEVTLSVLRGGQQVTVNAQLASRGDVEREAVARMAAPERPEGQTDAVVSGFVEGYDADSVDPPASGHGPGFLRQMLHTAPFTGLMMEAIEPQLAGYFGSSTGGGLLVQSVVADSPGAAAGLRAGDVVLRVDSVEVRTTEAWMKRLHAVKGQPMVLIVLRNRQEQTMTLIPKLKKHSEVVWPRVFCVAPTLA